MSSTYIISFEFIDVRKALSSYIETQPEVEILELLVYICNHHLHRYDAGGLLK